MAMRGTNGETEHLAVETTSNSEETEYISVGIPSNELANSIKEKLCPELPDSSEKCIWRVPERLRSCTKAYDPKIISIGPYHHGKEELQPMEKIKSWYLQCLLDRLPLSPEENLAVFVEDIRGLQSCADGCYADKYESELVGDKFVEMLILDGCFLLELFRKDAWLIPPHEDDPIFRSTSPWMLQNLYQDLILLENQIPWIVLLRLFQLSEPATQRTELDNDVLAKRVLKFFERMMLLTEPAEYKNQLEINHGDVTERENDTRHKSPIKNVLNLLLSCFLSSSAKPGNEIKQENEIKQGNEIKQENEIQQENEIEQENEIKHGNEIEQENENEQGNEIQQENVIKQENEIQQENEIKHGNEIKQENEMKHGNEAKQENDTKHRSAIKCLLNLLPNCLLSSSAKQENDTKQENEMKHRYEIKHVLHLLHNCLLSSSATIAPDQIHWKLVPPVTDLLLSGVKFKKGSPNNILNIKFSNGVFEIPPIRVRGNSESLFQNLIAYEECNPLIGHQFTSYAVLLDFLINTNADAESLCDKGIIVDALSTEDISLFCNRLYNETLASQFYFGKLTEDLDKYYRSQWPKWRHSLMSKHFRSPWSILSLVAAIFILLFTFTQTLFSILSY